MRTSGNKQDAILTHVKCFVYFTLVGRLKCGRRRPSSFAWLWLVQLKPPRAWLPIDTLFYMGQDFSVPRVWLHPLSCLRVWYTPSPALKVWSHLLFLPQDIVSPRFPSPGNGYISFPPPRYGTPLFPSPRYGYALFLALGVWLYTFSLLQGIVSPCFPPPGYGCVSFLALGVVCHPFYRLQGTVTHLLLSSRYGYVPFSSPKVLCHPVYVSAKNYLSNEVRHQVAKNNGIIGLDVQMGNADVCCFPQLVLVLVHFPGGGTHVHQNDLRITVNQPTTRDNLKTTLFCLVSSSKLAIILERLNQVCSTDVKLQNYLKSFVSQRIDSIVQSLRTQRAFLYLRSSQGLLVRSDQAILVAHLLRWNISLWTDHGVNSSNWNTHLAIKIQLMNYQIKNTRKFYIGNGRGGFPSQTEEGPSSPKHFKLLHSKHDFMVRIKHFVCPGLRIVVAAVW